MPNFSMNQDKPSNIFDEASKELKKVQEGQSHDVKKGEKGTPKVSSIPLADADIETMFNKMRKMDEDLQNRMERICELTGMSRHEVKSFIENPNNFTSSQWQKVQQEKDELERKIYASIGMKAKQQIAKKKKKKITKSRKGKTLGSRKGWIQM